VARPAAPVDPSLPQGRDMARAVPRPPPDPTPGCSFRRPVCVHRGAEVSGAAALEWLEALEVAYERVVLGLGAPAPLPDFAHGLGPELDLYLEASTAPLRTESDVGLAVTRDSGSAYCVVGVNEVPVDRTATLCLGEAIAHRLDTAEPTAAHRALAEHLWLATGRPTSADVAVVDHAQAYPDRALLERDGPSGPLLLLFEHLDRRGGVPTGIALAMVALAAGPPTHPSMRYHNEPDLLDVWRASHGPRASDIGRAALGFAIARAFTGTRSTGEHLPSLDFTGDAGRVRFDWSVPLSSLPRHLATTPVGPLGATYLWLAIDAPTDGVTLALQVEWEGPVSFAWSLVTVDGSGRLLGRFDVPYRERARHAERTLADLSGARGVLVVGTQLGDIAVAYPYDPDFSPHERHAASVHLARLSP
jgi:hypothetical protein